MVHQAKRGSVILTLFCLLATRGARLNAQETVISPPATDNAAAAATAAQRPLYLNEFFPRPELRVNQTDLQGAKFPAIDVHTHFDARLRGDRASLDNFVQEMNRQRLAMCVSLDAKLSPEMSSHLDYLWRKYPHRFAIFVHLDWVGRGDRDDPASWDCHQPPFARTVARQLEAAKRAGISGLKLFKQFGLGHRNPDGSLIRIDDPRWDPIWQACGELGLPVIMHTADPLAFFRPIDAHNERWEELYRHPEWSFPPHAFPARDDLLAARNRVIGRHPRTVFIGAHLANSPEDLRRVRHWLQRYPNLYVEPASRIGELGRQPYTARDFLIQNADRILLGTDGPWPATRIALYWRFFETRDEYFPYSEKPFPPQGFWRIYGVQLPDEVLRKIYFENALKIMPHLRNQYEAACREMN